MSQEVLRTEDIIEVLDDRLHASQDIVEIFVEHYEVYNSILKKIALQVCSPEQKVAIFKALTLPSSLNPVVLKDDIPTYYPIDDLGSFRDSVASVSDLPLVDNVLNDLRAVIDVSTIYRWDNTAWVVFIKTGTIEHTQLASQNSDVNFLHVSTSELSSLLLQAHTHINQSILASIQSQGSGLIISDVERSRLPTSGQKDAMIGTTSVVPSATNRYATTTDPRLNTVKNPYVTFGHIDTLATYQGSNIVALQEAMTAVALDVDHINALELLPGVYLNDDLEYQGISWSHPLPFLLEAFAAHGSVLRIAPQPAGSVGFLIGSGDGNVTIRGLTFELGGTATIGCLVQRSGTIFEDCTFTTYTVPIPNGNVGIQIEADFVTVRRCRFIGNLHKAIVVHGNNCLIESCRIDLNSINYLSFSILGHNTMVTSCVISQGTVSIASGVENTIFDKNRLTSNTQFIDLGINTRWLGSVANDFQQAYIGHTRTVGTGRSQADFRGDDDMVFTRALADIYTSTIEVLDGTYTFLNPVELPKGKTIRASQKDKVVIIGGFILNSSTNICGLTIVSTATPGLSAVSKQNIMVDDCTLEGTNYTIDFNDVVDVRILSCRFTGSYGIKLVDDVRSRVYNNVFSTTQYSLHTTSSQYLSYIGNTVVGSPVHIAGVASISQGNTFLSSLPPSKLYSSNSLWIGCYPTSANNVNGIDTIHVKLNNILKPIKASGCDFAQTLGVGVLSFLETGYPTAITTAKAIDAKIARAYGFVVRIAWLANVFSGTVKFEATTVFRETSGGVSDFSIATTRTALSVRSELTSRREEVVDIVFSSTDYGYLSSVDPTHVVVKIRRLGDDVADTLAGIVYITECTIIFTRD